MKLGNFNITWPSISRVGQNRSNRHIPISAFQFSRLKHDAEMWRAAIAEAELAFYPHRVKLQRMYMETIQNGHVHACINRRHSLVLLKDFGLFSGETCDEKATEMFKSRWFFEFMRHALDAKLYGYSLIELGDLVGQDFPYLSVTRRENVSPDRLVASSIVYQLSGIEFTDPSNEYYPWTVYVDTPTERGTSQCGYGLLYKVALYEIYLRNLIGSNANYNDKYGQPIRWGKTAKTEGKEYNEFCRFMDEVGENAWVVTDLNDEVEFIQAQTGNGAGFKTYDNFEQRLEKKISKVLLGHADALDSTPGKLGSQDGETSAVAQALKDVETSDCREIEHIVNNCLFPKLLKLGFPVPTGCVFRFKNDAEKEEIRKKQDESLKATADAVKILSEAGWEVSEKWINEHTGIEITKKEMPEPLNPPVFKNGTQKKLENLYR